MDCKQVTFDRGKLFSPKPLLKRSHACHVTDSCIPCSPQFSPEMQSKRLKTLNNSSMQLMSVTNNDNDIIATGTPWEKCIDNYGNETWTTTVCFIE